MIAILRFAPRAPHVEKDELHVEKGEGDMPFSRLETSASHNLRVDPTPTEMADVELSRGIERSHEVHKADVARTGNTRQHSTESSRESSRGDAVQRTATRSFDPLT